MVEGYKGRIFYEQFEAGSQGGNNPSGETRSPDDSITPKKEGESTPTDAPRQRSTEVDHTSVVRHSKTDTPQILCHKKALLSAEDAFPAGFRNPPPEGSFVFVCPLPLRLLAGRKIIQRLRRARHGGNDQSPGPKNPSSAK
jgi:hypothetical protein